MQREKLLVAPTSRFEERKEWKRMETIAIEKRILSYTRKTNHAMTFHDFILYVVNDTMRVQNTRDRLCIHERNCERRDKKKGEWGNEGENDGGVKQSETKNEKREGDGGQWRRREDRQTR